MPLFLRSLYESIPQPLLHDATARGKRLARQDRKATKQTIISLCVQPWASPRLNRHRLPRLLFRQSPLRKVVLISISFSYRPTSNDANDVSRFELEDDLKSSPAKSVSDELVTIPIRFISADFKIREKTFYRFLEGDAMHREFIAV